MCLERARTRFELSLGVLCHDCVDGHAVFDFAGQDHLKAFFQMVGRGIPDSIGNRASSSVRVVGFVDDIRPYMENASVMVVPLRIGGGMRLKILDALVMGKAVVATPVMRRDTI